MKSQLVVLAGPNGAGKSTFYDAFLSSAELPFLNADLLSSSTGVEPLEAARILDALRDRMIDAGRGFITETVFSDPAGVKLRMMRKAVDAGWQVTLIYIGLATAKLAAHRIDQRVRTGGHDVPRDRIRPRFERSLENLSAALRFVPTVKIYDNSSSKEPYLHIATFENGKQTLRLSGSIPAWARSVIQRFRKGES